MLRKILVSISRFFRQFAAFFTVLASEETGGVLFDYRNGSWDRLHVWSDEKTRNELDEIGANRITHMRDEILVAMVRLKGPYGECGTMQVVYPKPGVYPRVPKLWECFFCDLYPFNEAYGDTAKKCAEIAEKLGYRVPVVI